MLPSAEQAFPQTVSQAVLVLPSTDTVLAQYIAMVYLSAIVFCVFA